MTKFNVAFIKKLHNKLEVISHMKECTDISQHIHIRTRVMYWEKRLLHRPPYRPTRVYLYFVTRG